ncbi:DedA family protein [Saccharopolyspora phatthalungensis]|uniref:Membrane protein DedA with SNARE-associated domain n=1 Tax=Saccharopolyspora phatthalungensis TaxID=664693 RepID=A0A840QES0_9PSEU|nr:DedA family protein [Saccharopolyspora phatthalungensis]MBB5158511.1 membrane protein DedA with SNARE-associated domain [Saccharopolyspora phatthalungensis]
MPTSFFDWVELSAPQENAGEPYGVWAYFAVFALVLLSSAGMPFIGTFAVGGGAVLASQGHLDLAAVLIAAVLGGEAGGIVGYQIGFRWGRRLMERPGRRQEQRQKLLARGERLYETWGRLAVFVTTAMISGTANMKFTQFVVWNLITTTAFVLAVGPASYGAGRIVSGHHDTTSILLLVSGLVVAALTIWIAVRHRRRKKPLGTTV